MKIKYIAHSRMENGNEIEQSLVSHLEEVARLAEGFANVFAGGHLAYICGLLHDLGKYSVEFQNRIKNDGPKCDHATAGAKLLIQINKLIGELLGYIIMGHHGGLLDYGNKTEVGEEGTFEARQRKEVPDYAGYKEEIKEEKLKIDTTQFPPLSLPDEAMKDQGFTLGFFVRMLYSCVVDADYLDTEAFMNGGWVNRSVSYDFNVMYQKLNAETKSFPQDKEINLLRKDILEQCVEAGGMKKGLFKLSVPTGGGKTLASSSFALKHLITHKMSRVIYIIPFCSIIEQNAQVFSGLFGNDIVLEHHSNYDFENNQDKFNDRKKLASENWDMPFIVTTNVQFFGSLFANKSSKCRKLHNIANSVLIFDEVQAIPTEYLRPCIRAVSELVKNYGCTVLLCSATQPKLEQFFPKDMQPREIIRDVEGLFDKLKRNRLEKVGKITMEELAGKIEGKKQALIILNTKRQVRQLYQMLCTAREGDGVYHLSTNMYPEHRRDVIKEIRERLKQKLSCIVVSTNLIEAGVDLDFPEVYRELAGLDAIIQAAGRANRNGELPYGMVCVFSFIEEKFKVKSGTVYGDYLLKCSKNAVKIMEKHEDIFSPEAVDEYFTGLYQDISGEAMDTKGILQLMKDACPGNNKFQFQFKEVAEKFQLIEEDTCAVIIPRNEEAAQLVSAFRYKEPSKDDLRKLQKYMVNVRRYEYLELGKQGRVQGIMRDTAVLVNSAEYSMDTGLDVDLKNNSAMFY